MEKSNLADTLEASLKNENLIETPVPEPLLAPRSPPKKHIFKFSDESSTQNSIINPQSTGTPKFSENLAIENVKVKRRSNAGFFHPATGQSETEKVPSNFIGNEFEINGLGKILENAGQSANSNNSEESQSASEEFAPGSLIDLKKGEFGEMQQEKTEIKEVEIKKQKTDPRMKKIIAEGSIQQADIKMPLKPVVSNGGEKEIIVQFENNSSNMFIKQREEMAQEDPKELGYFNRNLSVNDALQFIERIHVEVPPSPKRSLFGGFLSCFRARLQSKSQLFSQKQKIQKFSSTPFSGSDSLHVSIFKKIFTSLKNVENCPMVGDHWRDIGFQGRKPETDLRKTGMFGALCILYFLEKYPSHSKKIYMSSLDPENRFPFASVCIVFSEVALVSLEKNILLNEIENNDRVYEVVLDYFCGLMIHWMKNFRNKSVMDVMNTKEETAKYASKHVSEILRFNH